MTRLPLEVKKVQKGKSEMEKIKSLIEECNQYFDSNFQNIDYYETMNLVIKIIEISEKSKYCYLLYPELRKQYRNFIFDMLRFFPNLKERSHKSVYSIMDLKNNYYYVK